MALSLTRHEILKENLTLLSSVMEVLGGLNMVTLQNITWSIFNAYPLSIFFLYTSTLRSPGWKVTFTRATEAVVAWGLQGSVARQDRVTAESCWQVEGMMMLNIYLLQM